MTRSAHSSSTYRVLKALAACLPVLLGAVILMIFALYDNYPILNNDSGTYISSGFTLSVPNDRPLTYGLFIRLSSLGQSLWLSIFCQSLILSALLFKLIAYLLGHIPRPHQLLLFLLISLGTIAGWYCSQLMPDIFTAVMGIALVNFLIHHEGRKYDLLYAIILFAAVLMHQSNLITFTLLNGIGILLAGRRLPFIRRRKLATTIALCILSWGTIFTMNYRAGYGFTASPSSHVFLMGKLSESGVLKTYLDKACPTRPYTICAFKDSLPDVAWSFVWDAPSPLQRTGGWDANKQEYNKIIRDIVTRPKYIPFLAYKSAEATARQLTQINIDESYELPWTIFDETTVPFRLVQQYFPHELNEFKSSRQNNKTLSIPLYDKIFALVLALSSCIALLIWPRIPAQLKLVYGLLIAVIILNAFATATFANVLSRLNSRVIWMLPMVHMLAIYQYARQRWFPAYDTGQSAAS